ncbi:hypothetical protein GCM10009744_31820 [Kribbella alba]|uniref:Uncharacterized protein n=1 Tax=Kribbella alba TaxID=190197 RepID=A0ABN2FBX0_9ACTN
MPPPNAGRDAPSPSYDQGRLLRGDNRDLPQQDDRPTSGLPNRHPLPRILQILPRRGSARQRSAVYNCQLLNHPVPTQRDTFRTTCPPNHR